MLSPVRLILAICFLFAVAWSEAGLIGYWNFDNSGNLGADGSGTGNALSANGGAAYTATGKFGGGLSLNGTSAYLSKTSSVTNLPTGNSPYTISAWFKPTATGARGIIGWGTFGVGRQVCALRLHNANDFRHYWWAADLDAAANTNYSNGQWHHILAVYNGSTRALWYDGVLIGQDSPGTNSSTNSNFGIGRTNSTEYFQGTLDDVAVWNHALTNAEIAALAGGGSPLNGPIITSFTSNKSTAFQGESIQLSWVVDTSNITGTYTYAIQRGATQIATGSTASGNFPTTIPDLAGNAQNIVYTFSAIETGGNNVTRTADVTVSADPGKPTAANQGGLVVQSPTSLPITLGGSDPNGGTLVYSIVSDPTRGTLSGSPPNVIYDPIPGSYGPDSFTFKVNDGTYDSNVATVSLQVNAPPTAPGSIALSSTQIPNTKTSGAWIADLSSQDVNVGESHTFTLVPGEGSTDNARFTISGHQLRAAQSFAVPAGTTYQIRVRSTDATTLFVEQSFVLTAVTPPSAIVINEVLFNGIDNTIRNEFIELYNNTAATQDLSGWRLSGAIDYAFPPGSSIASGAFLLIAEDPATILARFAKTALGPWAGSLSSKGETIRLRNASDVVVSEVDYRVGFPWPVVTDGDGTSMELIHPSLDPGLGSSWRPAVIPAATATSDTASPGAQNLQFNPVAAPAIRQVEATPGQPAANVPIVITARVTDPDGVGSVQLQYQIVTPGNFIPATLPKPIVNNNINTSTPLSPNPAFENAANWTTVAMNDDGINGDLLGGDGIYTGTIPGQAHRTLVRYRITVADNPGASVRVPYSDDLSRNFGVFVYNGVPDYQGTPSATLTQLPTYHFLTRKVDYDQCVAYDTQYRLTPNTPGWTWENWEAAFVYEGKVYDHLMYRLHGANGRYQASGTGGAQTSKRAFKFIFNKGLYFLGRDHDGLPYPTEWKTMITENCWENRATYTFSLNEVVNYYLWNQLGIPSPLGNWAHFRTIMQTAEQPDAWRGDFWGLMYVHEDYDSLFLDAHELPAGNLYKLTKDNLTGVSQQRYQAPFAPKDGSDHDQLQSNLRGTSTPAFITGRVNLDLWARYHALSEAIRHYDYWPSGDNNAAYYFYPDYNTANASKGVLWYLPSDVDATWGPTWNNGHDLVHNSLFNDSISAGGDASTNPTLWPRYFNQVREIRDLLWQQNQIDPLIEQFASIIRPFVNADFARWYNAPNDAGNFNGLVGPGTISSNGQISLTAYINDMRNFAWNGGTWSGGNVGAGGRAAFLDSLQNGVANSEGSTIPNTPTITHSGTPGFPVNSLFFSTSNFIDPQGAGTFAAVQWRMAEVNTSATYVPGQKRLLEIVASHESGEITPFASQFRFPASACEPGKRYRARVRHKDTSGRWSHWSAAVEFTAAAADVSIYTNSLVISEFMYHPTEPTGAEVTQGWAEEDFEYIEVRNVGSLPVDLTDVRFTKGIDFNFPNGLVLQPNANTVVVRNTAAFTSRHGAGKPIAGQWEPTDNLSNGGEDLKLSFGAGTPIIDFIYDDAVPWPVSGDGGGPSLVLIRPETRPDPRFGTNWRASFAAGGSPGGDDRSTFASWSSAYPGVVDRTADNDFDGLCNGLEYALSGDPLVPSVQLQPQITIQTLNVSGVPDEYLTVTFRRPYDPGDVTYEVQFTDDLVAWTANGILFSTTIHGDGTVTEIWRSAAPASVAKHFARLKVVFKLP
jgi:hypothetical protein